MAVILLDLYSLFADVQVTIWGDYGRVEGTKVFMGVAQILLDNLELSHIVIGWYKLFGTSSLVSVPPGGGKEAARQAVLGAGNKALPDPAGGGGGGGGGGQTESGGPDNLPEN